MDSLIRILFLINKFFADKYIILTIMDPLNYKEFPTKIVILHIIGFLGYEIQNHFYYKYNFQLKRTMDYYNHHL
jgi:hypothetical protein